MPATVIESIPATDSLSARTLGDLKSQVSMAMAVHCRLAVRSTANYSGLQLERLNYEPTLAAVFDGAAPPPSSARSRFSPTRHRLASLQSLRPFHFTPSYWSELFSFYPPRSIPFEFGHLRFAAATKESSPLAHRPHVLHRLIQTIRGADS